MSDLSHRFVLSERSCVCGSTWNFLAEGCSSLYPLPIPARVRHDDIYGDDWDNDFFECRKGHAMCGRH